ncbi:MAG: hypothetical protein UU87_C0003G0084 [Parcubacteria group bacterium GW2011_GWA2_42_11]|nr:MAG: hypothetical protein UU87_C0003G0084 [Parcubacteria group bacterium GW2011_GWA2_42_11]
MGFCFKKKNEPLGSGGERWRRKLTVDWNTSICGFVCLSDFWFHSIKPFFIWGVGIFIAIRAFICPSIDRCSTMFA